MPGAENDTPARVKLGERLYFDKRLSKNETQACNSCHRVDGGLPGVDNEPTSEGAFGKRGDRNSPTVLNAGFLFAQFWDGRASNLTEQAKGPVLNPGEMAMPTEAEVVKRLKAEADYPRLFAAAFPGTAEPLTYQNMAEAIASFERTLRTRDAFDDFQLGDDKALSPEALAGLDQFMKVGCTTCHTSPTLGGTTYQKVGLVNPYPNAKDLGRFDVTKDDDDKYKFKVPTLRNVALTWPYFHDGGTKELRDAAAKMGYMQLGLELTADQLDPIVAFLQSLSAQGRKAKG
jgi:cytochrome c peroxidase